MKVAILTFRWANNYGALLQAYGLRRVLESLGAEVVFPDYAPAGARVPWWRPVGVRQGIVLQSLSVASRCQRFRQAYLPCTPRCESAAAVADACRDRDVIVVGSDQVWNGNGAGGFNPVYFLDVPLHEGCRRVAYAACFGQTDQLAETASGAGRLLGAFDAISVRNGFSRELVERYSGRDALTVLDPTLLHDYAELSREGPSEKGYIVVYSLGAAHRPLGEWVAERAKRRLRLPVVTLYPDAGFGGADRRALRVGPIEWLEWMKGASLVLTNSFHGTTFALQLGKRFIAWAGSRSNRLEDLLERAGASDRLVRGRDERQLDDLLSRPPEPDRLGDERARSLAFLRRALS